MKTILLHIIIFLVLAGSNSILNAQELPVEDAIIGWQDSLDVGFGMDWQKGSTDQLFYNYNFSYATIFEKQWDAALSIKGNYGKTEGEVTEHNHLMELDIERLFYDGHFAVIYIGSIETDRIQNIYTRITSGVGPKWWPIKGTWVLFSVYSVPILDYTRTSDFLESERQYRLRNDAKLVINFTKDGASNLVLDYKYIPKFDDFNNYRSEFSAILTFNVYENLSFNNTFMIKYNSHPLDSEVTKVKKKNYYNVMGITLSF